MQLQAQSRHGRSFSGPHPCSIAQQPPARPNRPPDRPLCETCAGVWPRCRPGDRAPAAYVPAGSQFVEMARSRGQHPLHRPSSCPRARCRWLPPWRVRQPSDVVGAHRCRRVRTRSGSAVGCGGPADPIPASAASGRDRGRQGLADDLEGPGCSRCAEGCSAGARHLRADSAGSRRGPIWRDQALGLGARIFEIQTSGNSSRRPRDGPDRQRSIDGRAWHRPVRPCGVETGGTCRSGPLSPVVRTVSSIRSG